ncbi:MAG TPA: hypothetical protein EYP43_03405, partial [Thermoplasmata archaeon]|nr:hypothetical protein [Thermoplasmata archaeon]
MIASETVRLRTLLTFAGVLVVGLLMLLIVTQVATADVNVNSLSVSPTSRAVSPGKNGSYTVTIEIDQTSSGTANIWANLTNGTGGWMAWISGSGQSKHWSISNDQTLIITCVVHVPDTADVDDDPFTATLVVTSDLGSDGTISWDTTVKQTYGVVLDGQGGTSKNGDRGDQVPFNFLLQNLGNGADTITIDYQYTASDITVSGPTTKTLQKSSSTTFTAYVDISDQAEAKTFHITVLATSEDGVTTDSVDINVTVNPDYTYTLSVDDSAKNATPNAEATYYFLFENGGNVEVSFDVITLEDISPWSVSVNPTQFTLDGKQTKNITVTVKPDVDALAFTSKTVTVVVVPESGKGTNRSVQISTEVKQKYAVHLEGSSPSGKIMPGEWGEATVTVVNDGNGEDTFNLVASMPAGWSYQFVPTSTITIPGNQQDNLTLRIFVAEDALYGPHNVFTNATSNEKPSVVSLDLSLTVDVDQKYGVLIENADDSNKEVDIQNQARVVAFNFTVTNDGNKEDVFTFQATDVDATGWGSITFSPTSVTLDPDYSQIVSFSVKVPHEYQAGDYQWQIKAEMGDGNFSAPLVYTVTVEQYYDFDIMSHEINTSRSDLDPEGDVYISLVVKNIGNDRATVEFDAVLPSGWDFFTFTPSSITIDKDAETDIQLQVQISTDALKQTYLVMVQAIAKATSTVTDEYEVSIAVNQTYDVKVTIGGPDSQHTEPGDAVQYIVQLHNEGNYEDNIAISVPSQLSGWDYEFSPSSNPLIDANSVANITLTITPPDDAVEGSYFVGLKASTHGVEDTSQGVTVIVDQVYNIELTTPTDQIHSAPDRIIYFFIDVENKGTGNDSITMSKDSTDLPTEATVTLINTTHQMLAREIKRTTVKIALPKKEDIDLGSYYVRIQAKSENGTLNQPDDDIIKTIDLTVVIDPVYQLLLQSSDTSKEGEPEQTIYYTLEIYNTGTGESKFWVNKTGARKAWATHEPLAPTIQAG